VRHLLWLSLTLICGTPLVIVPFIGAVINWLAESGVPDIAFRRIPAMVAMLGWTIGSLIGFWLRWKRLRSLVNLASWGIAMYLLNLTRFPFFPRLCQ
jgi:hypothetical protein